MIDLFNNCDINIYVDEQIIDYCKNDWKVGRYYIKNELFIYSGPYSSKDIRYNYLNILKPIIEEGIKRKIIEIK